MKKRSTYSKEFKKRVALEAIRGEKTVGQIAQDFELHANQVRDLKKQALEGLNDVFATKRGRKAAKDVPEESQLFEQIGRLKVENEFLKKVQISKRSETSISY